MFINGIQGFTSTPRSVSFSGKKYDSKTAYSDKFIDLDRERELLKKMDKVAYLLDYGVPKKVVFAYDDEFTFATVRLYNEKEKCFYSADVLDEDVDACTELFVRNGVDEDNILYWDVIKGTEEPNKPIRKINPGESVMLDELGTKEQAAVRKALLNMHKRELKPVILSGPVTYTDDDKKYKMSYGTFISRTFGTDFNFYPILDDLNKSTANAFKTKDIDSIIVTPDGTMMEIRTKDGSRAFMDFNTGRRRAFGGNPDASGYGTILLIDDYGPVIRRAEDKPLYENTYEKPSRKKAVNENQSFSSRLFEYFGIKQNGKHFRK